MPTSFITSTVKEWSCPHDMPALNTSKCSVSIRRSKASAIGPCRPLVSDRNKTLSFRQGSKFLPITQQKKRSSLAQKSYRFSEEKLQIDCRLHSSPCKHGAKFYWVTMLCSDVNSSTAWQR